MQQQPLLLEDGLERLSSVSRSISAAQLIVVRGRLVGQGLAEAPRPRVCPQRSNARIVAAS